MKEHFAERIIMKYSISFIVFYLDSYYVEMFCIINVLYKNVPH